MVRTATRRYRRHDLGHGEGDKHCEEADNDPADDCEGVSEVLGLAQPTHPSRPVLRWSAPSLQLIQRRTHLP